MAVYPLTLQDGHLYLSVQDRDWLLDTGSPASFAGRELRMFFDTGAQLSYLQDEALGRCPPLGPVTDFHPGMGEFQTETYLADLVLAERTLQLRCGSLPGLLGMTLTPAGTEGILGDEVIRNRKVGCFPGRSRMVFA